MFIINYFGNIRALKCEKRNYHSPCPSTEMACFMRGMNVLGGNDGKDRSKKIAKKC